MQYPVIDLITSAYINNGWTGLNIPETIEINYYQEGNGDPSPDNIRPIHPGAIFNINGNQMPVYKGYINVVNKQLVLTFNYLLCEDASNFVRYTTGNNMTVFRKNVLASGITTETDQVSNIFKLSSNANVPLASNENTFVVGSSGNLFVQSKYISSVDELNTFFIDNTLIIIYPLNNPIIYNIDSTEIAKYLNGNALNDISHRLKLPLTHYFPHPVIDALQRAAAGTQTTDDTEILQHYLTPLGIGGI